MLRCGVLPTAHTTVFLAARFTTIGESGDGSEENRGAGRGEDSRTGESFVLNTQEDYTEQSVSEMDWTNQCPIPSTFR